MGIFEVFADTLVVCTLTALVILTSGVADGGFTGAGMTSAAFSAVLGPWGGKMVSISLIFYAVAAIIGWSFYGEQSLSYLMPHKKNAVLVYRFLFLFCCFLGAVTKLDLVWGIADTLNGLMAAPNLLALLTLSDVVFRTTKDFLEPEQRFFFKKPQEKK